MMLSDTSIKKHLLSDIAITEEIDHPFHDEAIANISHEVATEALSIRDDDSLSTSFDGAEKDRYTKTGKSHAPENHFFIPDEKESFSINNKNYFSNSQRWIGNVISINNDGTFSAKLHDLKMKGSFEEADFQISEVSEDDKELLSLGHIFYWSVGFSVRSGQVSKQSIIKFQRLPAGVENFILGSVDKAADRASNLFRSINWE